MTYLFISTLKFDWSKLIFVVIREGTVDKLKKSNIDALNVTHNIIFINIQTPGSGWKKPGAAEFLKTDFKVSVYIYIGY